MMPAPTAMPAMAPVLKELLLDLVDAWEGVPGAWGAAVVAGGVVAVGAGVGACAGSSSAAWGTPCTFWMRVETPGMPAGAGDSADQLQACWARPTPC